MKYASLSQTDVLVFPALSCLAIALYSNKGEMTSRVRQANVIKVITLAYPDLSRV
jgi:hypothetical protein